MCRMQASSGMHERRATVLKYLRDAEAGTHEGTSAKAEGATVIILVDFENTHASGLEGYTYLNESDTLVMYYSDENSAVTKGVVDDLRKNGVHVRLVKLLKQHSNALDMYIASTTGMFLDSGEKICIVSKDHGYAAVRDFWHSLRGAEILLGETIKQCLLSSELNDEARIRLCKEREQKAMLVDAFTTMNTIPTRPTLSRSNQRRRRNDTRNFMEVSEPVAILPNPLMTETPADQLAKELSSAVAKSENTAREAQPDTAAQQETAMTASVSSDAASDVAAITEAEASTTTGGERGGRGRNGRNRRNDQNHRNDRNDRSERDDRNAQNRSDATAAEKIDSEQRTGREIDARTQNVRSTREQDGTAEQNTTSEPVQERFGGYDGIMKMNEASRIALDKRQERDERKDEQDEPSAARNRNHPKQNAQPAEKNRRDARSVNDEKQRTSENRKQEEKSASEDTKKDIANAPTRTQVTQETTALVKAEKKTTAVAKVDPNRVQFVWDPITRSMKRVGGPAEEINAEKKEDAQKADAAEKRDEAEVKVNADATEKSAADAVKNTEAVAESTADHPAEKDTAEDTEKSPSAAGTKTTDVSGASEKDAAAEKRLVDVTAQTREAAADHRADVSDDAKTTMEEKTAVDASKSEDVKQPAAETASEQLETAPEKTLETVITEHAVTATEEKADSEHVQAGQDVATDDTKPDVETKKSGAHRKSKRSASVKKESDASEKSADTKKAATSSKPKAKKKAAVKHEKSSEKGASASVKTSLEDAANASEKTEMKSESTAPASKKKSGKSPKKVEDDVTVDAADAQPALQMTEEDIQLTKKKYSEGINTLHTYYVRLMKAFGREQGRAIYESTKKSVQEDIKARKAQLAAQNTQPTAEPENN